MSEFRKNWTEDKLKVIMEEWDETLVSTPVTTEESEEV
jgi:hypothetical protein